MPIIREENPSMSSISAELFQFYRCNSHFFKRIKFEFENGKFGIRKIFNKKVFNSLIHAFRFTNVKLQGLFNLLL